MYITLVFEKNTKQIDNVKKYKKSLLEQSVFFQNLGYIGYVQIKSLYKNELKSNYKKKKSVI